MNKIDKLRQFVEQGKAASLSLTNTKILKNKQKRDRNDGRIACYDEILYWINEINLGNL